jgi:hypothetical protein
MRDRNTTKKASSPTSFESNMRLGSHYPSCSGTQCIPCKNICTVYGLKTHSSQFHVIVSQAGSPRAKEFLKAVVQPTLDAIELPGDSYTLYGITHERPLGELVAHTIRPLAQSGMAQTILLVAGDQSIDKLVNALAIQTNEHPAYFAPVIGVLALGQDNTFAYSLEQNTSSTSLGLNAFLKGKAESLPLIRVSLSDGWSWQTDGKRRAGKVAKTLYATSSVSLGPAPCTSKRDTNKSETQSDVPIIPHAYANKIVIHKSARVEEVIGGGPHCYASAEIPTDSTASPTTLSFSYSALRPGYIIQSSQYYCPSLPQSPSEHLIPVPFTSRTIIGRKNAGKVTQVKYSVKRSKAKSKLSATKIYVIKIALRY